MAPPCASGKLDRCRCLCFFFFFRVNMTYNSTMQPSWLVRGAFLWVFVYLAVPPLAPGDNGATFQKRRRTWRRRRGCVKTFRHVPLVSRGILLWLAHEKSFCRSLSGSNFEATLDFFSIIFFPFFLKVRQCWVAGGRLKIVTLSSRLKSNDCNCQWCIVWDYLN